MRAMDDTLLSFWLAGIPGIGRVRGANLVKRAGSLKKLYKKDSFWVENQSGLRAAEIKTFLESRDEALIWKKWDDLKKQNICFIPPFSKEYPQVLNHLTDPPCYLYRKGKALKRMPLCISIVGARDCTCYGRDMARMFAFRLAKSGVGIVSGMARGIDGWAHQGALEAGGYTVAVLGSGVDVCYPSEHRKLYDSICRQGTVLSEYHPGTRAKPQFFPLRNRIISGLSDGVLLIEAKERSGSLITVEAALDQGKDVFVVPGRIGDTLSVGCNRLIVQGAIPVLSPSDILAYYGIEENDIYNRRNMECREMDGDASIERKILKYLCNGVIHVDILCSELNLSMTEALKALNKLRNEGKVRETARGYFGCL